MGCSSEKVIFEPHDGPGLRKETYKGKPTSAADNEITMYKWYCKYLEWRKQSFLTKETIGDMRKEIDGWYAKAIKDKRWKFYIDQCTQEKIEIDGPDGNKI